MNLSNMLKYAADFVGKPKGGVEVFGKESPLAGASVEELAQATEINAAKLAEVYDEAANGDPRSQAALAFDLLDRDTSLGAHFRTRRLAVSGCDWSVVSADEGGEEKAAELRTALDSAGMASLIGHLAAAWWYGYAGALIQWDGDQPAAIVPCHPTRWVFDQGGNPAIKMPDRVDIEPLASLVPGSAVFAAPGGGALPQRAGVCRPIGWMWMFKRNAWLWRSRYIERFGMPVVKATVPEEQWKDKERMRKLMASLDAMASKARVAVPTGASLDFISAVSGGGNADYAKYISDCNDEIMLAILGQLASAGEAGGLSKGQTQENVRLDLLAADCRMIEDAVQRMLLNPLVAASIGETYVGEFVFKLDYEPNEDEIARANIVETLNRAGLKVDEEWASKRFEMPLKRDGGMIDTPQAGEESKESEGAVAGAGVDVAATALNGAQITSIVTLLQQASVGNIPMESLFPVLKASFPMVAPEMLEQIVRPLKGFQPPASIEPMSDLSPRQARSEGRRKDRVVEGIAAAAMSRLMDDPEAAAAWVAPLKAEIAAVFADVDPDSDDLPAKVGAAASRLFAKYPAVYAAMGGNAGAIEDAVRVAAMTAVAASQRG